MLVFRDLSAPIEEIFGGVLVIGNFDGVHHGHQHIIEKAKKIAKEKKTLCGVLTFAPHPRQVFQENTEAFRLTSDEQKIQLIQETGVDFLLIQKFDLVFSRWEAEEFVERILTKALNISHVVVGENFTFGYRRKGTTSYLEHLGQKNGFEVEIVKPLENSNGKTYSSSHIRSLIKAGKIKDVKDLLGRYWDIESVVVSGDQRGREIGFPTANIELNDYIVPAYGVYFVSVQSKLWQGIKWGVANVGVRPTVGGNKLLLEVHLLDENVNCYDQALHVSFLDYIRSEKKFDCFDDLKKQIEKDCHQARLMSKSMIMDKQSNTAYGL